MKRRARLLLWAAATDATFERATVRGIDALCGRCIHCGRPLAIDWEGRSIGPPATLEHLLPRSAGGDDRLENLAVACARCNHRKGAREDARRARRGTADRALAAALDRRRARFRSPPRAWPLPGLPADVNPPMGSDME